MIPTASGHGAADPAPLTRLVGVGTAVPATSYTQTELLDAFRIDDPRIRSVFLNSAIQRRHLTLPPEGSDGRRVPERQGELLGKHRQQAVDMAVRAVTECLKESGAAPGDIRYLCCVTSTGFLTPGLSALVLRELGIERHCGRLDIVGMGCNAGLNALNAVSGWARANPGQLAVMVCAEACSAAYVFDGTMQTSVVNSLFGDGAAAIAAVAHEGIEARAGRTGPRSSSSPASSSPRPWTPCASTGTAPRTGSASSSIPKCPMWWAPTPRRSSPGSWPERACAGAGSTTG
ncbi:hypothetical protein ACM614_28685 [Streptomyces sp. 12297]